VVMLEAYDLEVLSSDLGWDMTYSDLSSYGFPQSLK
jgi:hypothetical protein